VQTARAREQVDGASRSGALNVLSRLGAASARLQGLSGPLTAVFVLSLATYLVVKVVGVVVKVPQATELILLPAGVSALGLGLSWRRYSAAERAVEDEQTETNRRPGIAAGAVLAVFAVTYLALNTVPMVSSQDETAIVNGGHNLVVNHSLQALSPLNDRYDTNIFGALHVMYQTPTHMYYRTFAGSAMLYAPFSVLPGRSGYYLFSVLFGTVAVLGLYGAAWKLLGSWWAALLAGALFATSPAFGHWAVTVFNNVPVLSLELCALAVVLWSRRGRSWPFVVAGGLMAVAVFTRWTEVVYVPALVVLAWWRTRGWRAPAALLSASLLGPLLIVITNHVFYGDAAFSPYGGSKHLALPGFFAGSLQGIAVPGTARTYARISLGSGGSFSHLDVVRQAKDMLFHLRYLGSSTFAFPFLAIALIALAWRLAAGRRDGWLLVSAVGAVTAAIVLLYGRADHNYYGYDQPIVRSSIIRYSLPFYALLAVAAAAFFADATRVIRGKVFHAGLPVLFLAVIGTVGVAQSYDANVYGFNRLNSYRSQDEQAWSAIKSFLDHRPAKPVIVVGPIGEKLVDGDYEANTINIDMLPLLYRDLLLFPVLQRASQDRGVYVVTADGNPDEKAFRLQLFENFRPREVLRAGGLRVYRLDQQPRAYLLVGVDVWRVYAAFDRWEITPEGRLRSIAGTPYFQLTSNLDANFDGRLDQDAMMRVQLIDRSDRPSFTISALDTRYDWRPVPLLSGKFGNTGQTLTFDVLLPRGAYYGREFIASPGMTLITLAIVPQGG
jgi:hypothetical protein